MRVVSQADQASVPASAAGMVSGARSVTAVTLPASLAAHRRAPVPIRMTPSRHVTTRRDPDACYADSRDLDACLRRLSVIWTHVSADSA